MHSTAVQHWDNDVVIDVLAAGEAAQTLPPLPAWSVTLFVAAGLWWFGFLVGAVCARALRTQRRLYWMGYGGVAVLCGAAMLPRGWGFSVWALGLVGMASVGWAFARTGYLKIGGRLFTLSAADRRRDEKESGERLLDDYRDLIRRFAAGEMSADDFEVEFLERFKNDPHQVVGAEFDVLDRLFAEVNDYVGDPSLRKSVGGISGEDLRSRVREVYARLLEYEDR